MEYGTYLTLWSGLWVEKFDEARGFDCSDGQLLKQKDRLRIEGSSGSSVEEFVVFWKEGGKRCVERRLMRGVVLGTSVLEEGDAIQLPRYLEHVNKRRLLPLNAFWETDGDVDLVVLGQREG